MDIIAPDDIARPGPGHVNGVAVPELHHEGKNVVVFDHVVASVQEGHEFLLDVAVGGRAAFLDYFLHLRTGGTERRHRFVAPDRARPFTNVPALEVVRPAAGDGDTHVGDVVDEIVVNMVAGSLEQHDRGAGQVIASDELDGVVGDFVAAADVLGAGTVSGDDHGRPTEIAEFISDDPDVTGEQIQPDTARCTVDEGAVLHEAILRGAETQHGVRCVMKFPIMLQAGRAFVPRIAVGFCESQPAEFDAAHRCVLSVSLHFAFDFDERGRDRGSNFTRIDILGRPEIKQAFPAVRNPTAGLVEKFQAVLDPATLFQLIRQDQRTGRAQSGADNLKILIHGGQRQIVELELAEWGDGQFHVCQVGPVLESAPTETELVMRVPCILVTGWLAEDANLLRAGPGQSLSAGKQGVDSPTGSLRPGSRENMPPRPLRDLGG